MPIGDLLVGNIICAGKVTGLVYSSDSMLILNHSDDICWIAERTSYVVVLVGLTLWCPAELGCCGKDAPHLCRFIRQMFPGFFSDIRASNCHAFVCSHSGVLQGPATALIRPLEHVRG